MYILKKNHVLFQDYLLITHIYTLMFKKYNLIIILNKMMNSVNI